MKQQDRLKIAMNCLIWCVFFAQIEIFSALTPAAKLQLSSVLSKLSVSCKNLPMAIHNGYDQFVIDQINSGRISKKVLRNTWYQAHVSDRQKIIKALQDYRLILDFDL